jgi:hypothetical protein
MNDVDLSRLVDRIADAREKLSSASPEMRSAYTKIGLRLSNLMKINAKKENIGGDTGTTRQNITYRLVDDGVEAGVYGVPHAKYHEFGTKPSHKMWIYLVNNLFLEQQKNIDKDVLQFSGRVGTSSRMAWIKARPFIRPAIEDDKTQQYIIDTIRDAVKI